MMTTQQWFSPFHNTLIFIKWLRYAFQNVISMIKNSSKKNLMAGTITRKTKGKAEKGPKDRNQRRERASPTRGRKQSQSCFYSVFCCGINQRVASLGFSIKLTRIHSKPSATSRILATNWPLLKKSIAIK